MQPKLPLPGRPLTRPLPHLDPFSASAVASPGYGWAPGNNSVGCPVGYYNPGYNNRKCTRCPGSLTTAGPAAVNLQDCRAGPGFYYVSGKAVACAEGFYKSYVGNFDCNECPVGFTTPQGLVGQTDKSACTGEPTAPASPPELARPRRLCVGAL